MSDRWIEAEFETIFREHYQRIVRVTRRVLQRDSDAEEVCAEVFLRLYRSGPGVASGGLVGGWLYRTATRASIDALRANRRHGVEEELESDAFAQSEGLAEDPLTLLLRRERIVEVREVLAKLKVEKAQLLLLRHSGQHNHGDGGKGGVVAQGAESVARVLQPLGGILASLLFATSPWDPIAYTAMALFLLGIALLSGYLPARRASRIEPMAALRSH
jgi:RNA polymerase sigma factor (sigma-70 family)